MESKGIVIELFDDRAKVKLQKHSACGDCGACQHGEENMEITIEALNKAQANVGDYVLIDLETANVLGAAFIVYVIPLATFLISLLGSQVILSKLGFTGPMELVTTLIGFVVMGITFFFIKKNETHFHRSKKYLSTIQKVVDKNQCSL